MNVKTQLKWSAVDLDKGHALIHLDESKTKIVIPVSLNKQLFQLYSHKKVKTLFIYLPARVSLLLDVIIMLGEKHSYEQT